MADTIEVSAKKEDGWIEVAAGDSGGFFTAYSGFYCEYAGQPPANLSGHRFSDYHGLKMAIYPVFSIGQTSGGFFSGGNQPIIIPVESPVLAVVIPHSHDHMPEVDFINSDGHRCHIAVRHEIIEGVEQVVATSKFPMVGTIILR